MRLPIDGGRIPRSGNGAFGARRSPTHVHQGLDIAAPEGTPVRAADSGVVVCVVRPGTRGFSGYGACIVIAHERPERAGKLWTLYAHLKPDTARFLAGDLVRMGDHIADVGASCGTVEDPDKRCGGAHLHFEASKTPYPQRSEAPRLDPTFFLS